MSEGDSIGSGNSDDANSDNLQPEVELPFANECVVEEQSIEHEGVSNSVEQDNSNMNISSPELTSTIAEDSPTKGLHTDSPESTKKFNDDPTAEKTDSQPPPAVDLVSGELAGESQPLLSESQEIIADSAPEPLQLHASSQADQVEPEDISDNQVDISVETIDSVPEGPAIEPVMVQDLSEDEDSLLEADADLNAPATDAPVKLEHSSDSVESPVCASKSEDVTVTNDDNAESLPTPEQHLSAVDQQPGDISGSKEAQDDVLPGATLTSKDFETAAAPLKHSIEAEEPIDTAGIATTEKIDDKLPIEEASTELAAVSEQEKNDQDPKRELIEQDFTSHSETMKETQLDEAKVDVAEKDNSNANEEVLQVSNVVDADDEVDEKELSAALVAENAQIDTTDPNHHIAGSNVQDDDEVSSERKLDDEEFAHKLPLSAAEDNKINTQDDDVAQNEEGIDESASKEQIAAKEPSCELSAAAVNEDDVFTKQDDDDVAHNQDGLDHGASDEQITAKKLSSEFSAAAVNADTENDQTDKSHLAVTPEETEFDEIPPKGRDEIEETVDESPVLATEKNKESDNENGIVGQDPVEPDEQVSQKEPTTSETASEIPLASVVESIEADKKHDAAPNNKEDSDGIAEEQDEIAPSDLLPTAPRENVNGDLKHDLVSHNEEELVEHDDGEQPRTEGVPTSAKDEDNIDKKEIEGKEDESSTLTEKAALLLESIKEAF